MVDKNSKKSTTKSTTKIAKNPAKLDPKLTRLALVMTIGIVAPGLDATAVNVALPTIAGGLGAPIGVAQWTLTVYILMMGLAIPLSGWLVDRFPARRIYLGFLAFFTLASVGSALSPSIFVLIIFRALQGFSDSILLQAVQTVLMREAGEGGRGRVMAVVGVPAAILPIIGPVIGGVIVNWLAVDFWEQLTARNYRRRAGL
jgi:MFS family permease